MKPAINKLNIFFKEFLKYFFIVITLIIIGLLYPNRTYFNYEFQQGTKWEYETLKAPFNFPIIRTSEEITNEKNAIKNNFIPRFNIDSHHEEGILTYIDNISLDSFSETDISRFKNYLKKEITKLYSKGIVSSDDYKKIKNKGLIVNINNKAVKKDFSTILTSEKAKEYLIEKTKMFFPDLAFIVENLTLNPNYKYDTEVNQNLLKELLSKVSINAGVIKKGDLIIAKGDVITQEKYKILTSYKEAYSKQVGKSSSFYFLYLGYFLLSLLILGLLLLYLYKNRPDIYNKPVKFLFILMWIMIFSYIVHFADNTGEMYVYAIPFAIAPIIVLNFFNKQLALYLHIIIILIASLITKLGYEFTVLQLIVGMTTILIFSELRFWNSFFKGIFIILFIYITGYISLALINNGTFSGINWKILISFIVNALLLLLAYPLIPLIEKPFGFISNITISELGDLNKPLLKELSLKAPGTLQHSLQVANLCEAAAKKIGANSLLIKVGALYHDIGKTYAPEYFIENQRKGEDPYKDLDYFDSAKKIIDHVIIGEKMAIKHRLPKILQRFIITHHGTTRVEYFYRKQINDYPDKEFDESIFRYPGPKPKTKEETIMMIADSLEAATKSLNKPTSEEIDNMVDNISKFKIDDGQLQESELSFKEFEIVKEVFKDVLKNIHHVRIEYPELKK